MRTVLQALEEGRAKIEDPKHWIKGSSARDKYGYPTDAHSLAAVCWCALGAVSHILAEMVLRQNLPGRWGSVAAYNDAPTTTHADILALFDRAIVAEKAFGQFRKQ